MRGRENVGELDADDNGEDENPYGSRHQKAERRPGHTGKKDVAPSRQCRGHWYAAKWMSSRRFVG